MADRHFQNLGSFLDALRARGDLVEVEAEVDPKLEIAEIHRRVIAAGGPALLFRRPKDSAFPVVTNLFGARERVMLAFGEEPRELVRRIADLPHTLMPPSLGAFWRERGLFARLGKIGIRRRGSGPVLAERMDPVDLTRLPVITSWSGDGGPFLTLPLVYTEHPETGGHNLGMYRGQIFDAGRVGLHWQIAKGGGFHHAVAEGLNRELPVNIFLGGPPALILAATAPLPENVPELLLASLLAGGRFPMAANPAGPLPIAAEAEFAIAGRTRPGEREAEGPFGDHYGYYSLRHDYPFLRVDAVYHRPGAVYPATVVGKPRQEDFFIGDFLQEMLSPVFPLVMPGVEDLWSYGETGYHSLAAAVVKQRYKREAMASAFRILGEGQLSLTKFLLVLDRRLDLRDFKSVLEYVLERADFRTDLYVFSNLSMDTLDYTGPRINEGSKGVLLGVGNPVRSIPRVYVGNPPPDVTAVRVFCGGCLAISGPTYSQEPSAGERLVANEAFRDWPLLVLVDDADAACRTIPRFLWTAFTRFEPAGDMVARGMKIVRSHLSWDPPVLIDARVKPNLPDELFCDPDTAAAVSRRWAEYFPAGGVEMGDSDVAHLG